jgi:catechol 2,3-dioxygenase-like lactoylglutathione lyase family enzyme
MEPCHDIAHLGHVEVYTDRYEDSLDFFTRIFWLKLSTEDEAAAYLGAWDDYEFHTLKLIRHDTTGIGHVAYRATSPNALQRRVRRSRRPDIASKAGSRAIWVRAGRSASRIPLAICSRSITIRTARSRRKVSVPRWRTWHCDTTIGVPASAIWTEAERKRGQAKGLKTNEICHTHSTPPAKT